MGCYWALGVKRGKTGAKGKEQDHSRDLNKCPALPSPVKILHHKEWDNPSQTESSRAVGPLLQRLIAWGLIICWKED